MVNYKNSMLFRKLILVFGIYLSAENWNLVLYLSLYAPARSLPMVYRSAASARRTPKFAFQALVSDVVIRVTASRTSVEVPTPCWYRRRWSRRFSGRLVHRACGDLDLLDGALDVEPGCLRFEADRIEELLTTETERKDLGLSPC